MRIYGSGQARKSDLCEKMNEQRLAQLELERKERETERARRAAREQEWERKRQQCKEEKKMQLLAKRKENRPTKMRQERKDATLARHVEGCGGTEPGDRSESGQSNNDILKLREAALKALASRKGAKLKEVKNAEM
jgi:hypothetical protein